jgi:hypothetical protein
MAVLEVDSTIIVSDNNMKRNVALVCDIFLCQYTKKNGSKIAIIVARLSVL